MKEPKKTERQKKREAQLKKWAVKLAELEVKADVIVKHARRTAERRATTLRSQLTTARKKLHQLKQSTDEAWRELRPAVERSWADLRQSMKKAKTKF